MLPPASTCWVSRRQVSASTSAHRATRERQYTHEVIAEIYAVVMARRRRGETGQPAWLDDELYDLLRRVCGWNE
jgi:hypothetical protein